MDDDFNMPQALASVFELVTLTNKHINNQDFLKDANNTLGELLGVFGIGRSFEITLNETVAITEETTFEAKIKEREEARKDKNYALSDKIRKELEAEGIILEDTPEGPTWRKKL